LWSCFPFGLALYSFSWAFVAAVLNACLSRWSQGTLFPLVDVELHLPAQHRVSARKIPPTIAESV
jgi:hypothetical protein